MVLLLAGSLAACDRQSPSQEQASAEAPATSGEATGGGKSAETFHYQIDRSKAGAPAPADIMFQNPEGGDASLSDFAGRPVLVNLWATWCGPCVAEMPTLDKLASAQGDKGMAVLTISQDLQTDGIKAFFAKNPLPHLKGWADPENRLGGHYGTGVLPTSVLYNAQGKEVARVIGAIDWNGAEAADLIKAATGA
jgi:thiol-disulfide isomerase/thioredoxin